MLSTFFVRHSGRLLTMANVVIQAGLQVALDNRKTDLLRTHPRNPTLWGSQNKLIQQPNQTNSINPSLNQAPNTTTLNSKRG